MHSGRTIKDLSESFRTRKTEGRDLKKKGKNFSVGWRGRKKVEVRNLNLVSPQGWFIFDGQRKKYCRGVSKTSARKNLLKKISQGRGKKRGSRR